MPRRFTLLICLLAALAVPVAGATLMVLAVVVLAGSGLQAGAI